MKFQVQRRLAAQILKCSKKRVAFDPDMLEDIKEGITKADVSSLINQVAIIGKRIKGISKFRTRKNKLQKRKGRQRGAGSRKGKKTARLSKKDNWMNKIRIQREFLKELRKKKLIPKSDYIDLYRKSKGGFFRNKRHIKVYLEEHGLVKKNEKK